MAGKEKAKFDGPKERPNNDLIPRVFIDNEPIVAEVPESKSWNEYEQACKAVKTKGKELQSALEKIVKEWSEFEQASLKAFKKMPSADAMFSDSPLSPMRMQSAFRQNLAKLGWKWAAGLPWGPGSVRNFCDIVNDACGWGERIMKDKERLEKTEAAKKAKLLESLI